MLGNTRASSRIAALRSKADLTDFSCPKAQRRSRSASASASSTLAWHLMQRPYASRRRGVKPNRGMWTQTKVSGVLWITHPSVASFIGRGETGSIPAGRLTGTTHCVARPGSIRGSPRKDGSLRGKPPKASENGPAQRCHCRANPKNVRESPHIEPPLRSKSRSFPGIASPRPAITGPNMESFRNMPRGEPPPRGRSPNPSGNCPATAIGCGAKHGNLPRTAPPVMLVAKHIHEGVGELPRCEPPANHSPTHGRRRASHAVDSHVRHNLGSQQKEHPE